VVNISLFTGHVKRNMYTLRLAWHCISLPALHCRALPNDKWWFSFNSMAGIIYY